LRRLGWQGRYWGPSEGHPDFVNGAGLDLIFRLAEFATFIVAVWAEWLIETGLFNLARTHRSHGFFPLSQDNRRKDTTHGKRFAVGGNPSFRVSFPALLPHYTVDIGNVKVLLEKIFELRSSPKLL